MENLSYSSYPESGDSSPLTREIDENQSWEESQATYKVKFMCSYGGKIQPRPHDNQLAYVGGDTKILSVERNIKFSAIMNKLTSLCGDADVCFKYQLPGEDLDALISVTNDEDLDHMMLEYDRLFRASIKPARLRIFLFHLNPSSFGSDESKSDRQWYVNALNAVPVQNPEGSSPPAVAAGVPAGNAEFLFRLDKRLPPVPITKYMDTTPAQPTVPEIVMHGSVGSDGSEDRLFVGDAMVNQQIPDLQRLQISAANEQALNRKLIEEANNKAYAVEHYQQKVEKIAPPPTQVAMPMMIPATYMPERHVTSCGYAVSAPLNEQTVYQLPTATGAYQAQTMRVLGGQIGLGCYEPYKEQQMYNPVPTPAAPASIPQQQHQKVGVYNDGIGMVQTKVGVAEQGYMQVGYDAAGRQVYYTTQYQAPTLAAAQSPVFNTMNQEGKVQVVMGNSMAPQTSSG